MENSSEFLFDKSSNSIEPNGATLSLRTLLQKSSIDRRTSREVRVAKIKLAGL